jgi:hypothetical protein
MFYQATPMGEGHLEWLLRSSFHNGRHIFKVNLLMVEYDMDGKRWGKVTREEW